MEKEKSNSSDPGSADERALAEDNKSSLSHLVRQLRAKPWRFNTDTQILQAQKSKKVKWLAARIQSPITVKDGRAAALK